MGYFNIKKNTAPECPMSSFLGINSVKAGPFY